MANPVNVLIFETKSKAAFEASAMVTLGFDVVAVGPVDSVTMRKFTGVDGEDIAEFVGGDIFAIFCYNKSL